MEKNKITPQEKLPLDVHPTSRSKDWKRVIPGLIISVISLAVVFYLADLNRMLEALRLADYRLVALVCLITLLWLCIRALVWRTLLKEQATFKQVFFTVNEGYLLNNLLPFRLGEVGRAYLLGRKANIGFWQVLPTIVIERGLDMVMAASLMLITLPFVVGADWALEAAIGVGAVVITGIFALYLLARNQEWALRQFNRFSKRWEWLRNFGSTQLPRFFEGLSILTDIKHFLLAISWMALNWCVAICQYYVLLLAFFPDGKLLWGAFSLAVAALGIAAPSSPGGVGVLQLAIVGALSVFGLDPSISLALGLTAQFINYLITGIIGVYALTKDGLTLSGLYHQVRDIEQPS